MGATGQQAQHIFRPDNGKHESLGVAVDGAEEYLPAGFDQGGAGTDDRGWVRHVFQHFQTGHHVILTGALFGNLFCRGLQVFHGHAGLFRMNTGHSQWRFAHVDAGHLGATAGHAFGKQAATTADVDDLLARQADAFVDIVQAQGVDVVERAELGIRVPPLLGQGVELGDFTRVYVLLGGVSLGLLFSHGRLRQFFPATAGHY